jgi:[ribosomal protein S5]-alanine N-acetyltransferase
MQSIFTTARLTLAPLTTAHNVFILELVNTPGWLRFIGDRNVNNVADATAYIEKINNNPAITYWVVTPQQQQEPAGIITYIKRDYLDYPDIGFAFLPQYAGKGYALEAAAVVIDHLAANQVTPHLLATTIAENERSIGLLKKLGFTREKEMDVNGKPLLLFGQRLYSSQFAG